MADHQDSVNASRWEKLSDSRDKTPVFIVYHNHLICLHSLKHSVCCQFQDNLLVEKKTILWWHCSTPISIVYHVPMTRISRNNKIVLEEFNASIGLFLEVQMNLSCLGESFLANYTRIYWVWWNTIIRIENHFRPFQSLIFTITTTYSV